MLTPWWMKFFRSKPLWAWKWVWRWDRIIHIYMEKKEEYHQSEFRMLTGKWRKTWNRNAMTWQTDMYLLYTVCKYILLTFHLCFCFIYVSFYLQRWNFILSLRVCFYSTYKGSESWILIWFSVPSVKFITWNHRHVHGTLWQQWYLCCK